MSDKKVLGMSLFGIIKSSEPWKKSHEVGMKELAERAGMPELLEKMDSEDYFNYVEEALGKIDEYKSLVREERIVKRRGEYFDRVFGLIKEGDFVDEDFVVFLKELKSEYKLVLITTNTKDFVDEVLDFVEAGDIFDSVVFGERDDKREVFGKALNDVGKIDVFVGSEKSGKVCDELDVRFIEYKGLDKLREVLK